MMVDVCIQLGGIPLSVFQAMKARVAYSKQLAVRVPLWAATKIDSDNTTERLMSLAEEVSEAVFEASQSVHSHEEAVTSMAARVRLDHLSSSQLKQVSVSVIM